MAERAFAVLGLFDSHEELLEAIPGVKEQGFSELEAYTPYPVPDIDEALGIPKSRVGYMVFFMGLIGALAAFVFEWWTSAVSYPLITAGKPYNGWQAWIPVTLEATILFGTFTAGLGTLFVFNKLPLFGDPLFGSKARLEVTFDRFALAIVAKGGALDTDAATAALRSVGADAIEVVPEPSYPRTGVGWWVKHFVAITAACVVSGLGVAWLVRTIPRIKPYVEMKDQPRLDAQSPDRFFANGHGMQRPPRGTVARAYMPILATSPGQGGKALVDPLPVTKHVLRRGRHMFNLHCAVCHDKLGTGKPWLDSHYTAKPANLQSAKMRKAPDGLLYWVISKGYGEMPGYAADMSQDDRWAIVRYVRALQRSQHATSRDEVAARSANKAAGTDPPADPARFRGSAPAATSPHTDRP